MGDKSASGQTPSKVLHIRNLPYETTQEELEDLAKPFGKLVKTKLNVGANRNQAFIEFPDVQSAVQMVHHFMSSAEPAKVRGKTVYLQYSTRQEIVNATSSGEQPSNVLLATLENLQPETVITIEQLWAVFHAFGNVQKIATFEKSAGFQALVQYDDPLVAKAAKDQLDGRTIPRSILPDSRTPCQLRIAFSAHQDLNVKFQSHRGRDFTNPDLPWAENSNDPNVALMGIQAPLNNTPDEGNVLLVQIDEYQYDITVDTIYEVFKRYGNVQKVAIFQKNNVWQALVQYPDPQSAATAKSVLEGHAMYEGGYNVLRLSYSVHKDLNVKNSGDKSRDFSVPAGQPSGGFQQHPQYPPQSYGAPYGAAPDYGYHQSHGGYSHGHQEDVAVTGQDYVRAHEEACRKLEAYMGGGGPPGGGPPPGYGGPPRGPPPHGMGPYGAGPPRGPMGPRPPMYDQRGPPPMYGGPPR